MAFMDQKEIANFLAKELFYHKFIALDGLNSGVPTRTTPTLTPTTLRNIEQTFIELQSKPESHENEARFVPPLVHSIGNNQYIPASDADIYSTKSNSTLWQSSLSQSSSDSNTRPTPPVTPNNGIVTTTPTSHTRRNMGGRKPTKDLNISPEEEERRRVRRERNKLAAARCRKRRVDHTNALIEETESLEHKRHALQMELQELHELKNELEFALETHKQQGQRCRLQESVKGCAPDVKPYIILPQFQNKSLEERVKTEMIETLPDDDLFSVPPAKKLMLSSGIAIARPNRPNTLNVPTSNSSKNECEIAGIAITTPSTGMQFNFDSLMGGGTGLTPVSTPLIPNCSQQIRIPVSSCDIHSPDACGPPKLVSL